MKQTDYRLAAIMYTDIVGFSKMMGENEAETLNVLRTHNRILDEAVEACHGTVIKTIGDAYMVDFRNTVEALQCAVEVQEKIYEYNKQTGSYILLVRIGLHLGDIYFYEKDAFGDGINIAARLQSFAKPGCICFSQDVFNQVLNKVDFHAEKLGRVSLKNINKEIHAYEIETKNTEFDTEKTSRNRKILVDPVKSDENTDYFHNTGEKPVGTEKSQEDTSKADSFIHKTQDTKSDVNQSSAFESQNTSEGNENASAHSIENVGAAFETIALAAGKKISDFFEKLDAHQKKSKKNKARCDGDCEDPAWAEELEAELQDEDAALYYKKVLKKLKKENTQWDFARVQKRARARFTRVVSGFVGHLITFIFINALLWAINFAVFEKKDDIKGKIETELQIAEDSLTENEKAGIENIVNKLYEMLSEGFFPWAAIVSFAWGIGLVSNFVEIFTEYKKSKELQNILPLNEEEFSLYLRIAKHRSEYIQHLCSTITIPLFLRFLHVLFSFSFPWHLIVTAVLVFGLIMNSINYIPKRAKYVDRLCELKNCDNWRSLFG
ncbi:MAG TPA: adenylate/guanylate cyclase domain-containing protein [Treponemataceae bacterium]|nr:adenylate/guanylate cyclase domain-containing protein [Treponemataceae bacterium]